MQYPKMLFLYLTTTLFRKNSLKEAWYPKEKESSLIYNILCWVRFSLCNFSLYGIIVITIGLSFGVSFLKWLFSSDWSILDTWTWDMILFLKWAFAPKDCNFRLLNRNYFFSRKKLILRTLYFYIFLKIILFIKIQWRILL